MNPIPHTSVQESIKILAWNIEGLFQKLCEPDFITLLNRYDIICLSETFVITLDTEIFEEFDTYIAPAKRLSGHGRNSGGVICFVRRSLRQFIQNISCAYDNIVTLLISRELIQTESDTLLVSVYIPPQSSPYYDSTCATDSNGITLLEDCLLDLQSQSPDCNIILCGDFK